MADKQRVLWLLNHTTLRKFEAKQLSDLGLTEIFMPKSFPYDEGNLSANIDFSYDELLTIPQDCLAILNEQDWYGTPSDEAWSIVNQYFDVAIIGFFPEQIKASVANFKGAIVLRVFGLSKGYSYSDILYSELGPPWVARIKKLGKRFWFGAGYEHLSECEHEFLKATNCFLPVGLSGKDESHLWQGNEEKILFVCPRIGSSPYFKNIYDTFVDDFSGFNYTIGGAQPVSVSDSHVIGYVSRKQHDFNMRQHKVMFYHSNEPNHIHYHPFEAIQAGMPLIFMAGGMLDLMGGKELPGRCKTVEEARKKIGRILNNDKKLISQIRGSQSVLLEPMKEVNCEPAWRGSFQRILQQLAVSREEALSRPVKRKRVAIILPIEYRGGSLRGAKLLAQAISLGSQQANEGVEVTLVHLDTKDSYQDDEFKQLPLGVQARSFRWLILDEKESRAAMRFAGHQHWQPQEEEYLVADDGINYLQDCDLWIVVSDRLSIPFLPVCPVVYMVYDYLQRYTEILPHGLDQGFLDGVRSAERVLTTTVFTQQDALQYAGVHPNKVFKVPMLAPSFTSNEEVIQTKNKAGYFIWTTNMATHKNHLNAYKALQIYYEEYKGSLKCYVTGVETDKILKSDLPHLAPLKELTKKNRSRVLRNNIKWLGELPDKDYREILCEAVFLWHAGAIDNGTFSVIEAASVGVPALSSHYPAMREIDEQFSLNLLWMNADDPNEMALKLKQMESERNERKQLLPSSSKLAEQSVERLAGQYWEVIRQCL